jgi:hypothetical protein
VKKERSLTLPSGFNRPACQCPETALREHVASRDQARRLPVIARKGGDRVRLYSRPGNDLTYRFTLIVESLVRLRSRSCIIDGEAVCCDHDSGPAGSRKATRLLRSLRPPLYS